LKQELQTLNDSLENNPAIGIPWLITVIKYGWPFASKGKGKSGGARVITLFN